MDLKKDVSEAEIAKIFEKQYGKEHFVHYVKEPSIRAVVGSNHAHVSSNVLGSKVAAFGVLDNLVKGASGQAVQCMNLMLGIKETTGIDTPGLGV
jgi:N-acetyl-gamma-glutamylphosphate reductase